MALYHPTNLQNIRVLCQYAQSSLHCCIQKDLCRLLQSSKLHTNFGILQFLKLESVHGKNEPTSDILLSAHIQKHLYIPRNTYASSSLQKIIRNYKTLKCFFPSFSNHLLERSTNRIDKVNFCQMLETDKVLPDESKLTNFEMLNNPNIIIVKSDKGSFEKFINEWKSKDKFTINITVNRLTNLLNSKEGVGTRESISSNLDLAERIHNLQIQNDTICVTGFVVSWDINSIFYVPLFPELLEGEQNCELSEETLSFEIKLSTLKNFLEKGLNKKTVVTSNLQQLYRTLCLGCGIALDITSSTQFEDPRAAYWLLHPEQGERKVDDLICVYFPELTPCIQETKKRLNSICNEFSISSKAVTDIMCTYLLMDKLQKELAEHQMEHVFVDKEMPLTLTISKIELNGIGFDAEEAISCHKCLKKELVKLKKQAHSEAGKEFSVKCQDELEMVIQEHCGVTAEESNLTFNELLNKLASSNSLVATILDWRKVASALKLKILLTSLKQKIFHPLLSMDRVYGSCHLYSPHGLVTVTDPNLQMVPNNFKIYSNNSVNSNQKPISISVRNCFVPMSGGVILAADYSQFSIRMLAHLSKDKQLIDMLNKDVDVFRYIAAQWKQIDEDSVTDTLRLKTKQACFIIMYSSDPVISMKKVINDETEAYHLCEVFQNLCPGVTQYLSSVLEDCRLHGYIQILSGRRRYFPFINIEDDNFRRNAERQTFSTLIQGSCSDLFKNVLVNLDKNLALKFPRTKIPLKIQGGKYTLKGNEQLKERGAYIVNQIHDELLLDVAEENLSDIIHMVKKDMEESMLLSVKLTSRIKVGKSWGNLKEIT